MFKKTIMFAATAVCCSPALRAETGTWNQNASGDWSTSTNWTGGTIADGSTSNANFLLDITADRTVTLDSSRTIGNLFFNDAGTGTDSAWTLAGNPGSVLTLDNGINPATINKATSYTISAQLAGTNIKFQGGTNASSVLVSGNNTGITGQVEINSPGEFQFGNSNALGTASIIIGPNDPLLSASIRLAIENNITLSSGAEIWTGRYLTYEGTITVTSGRAFTLWSGGTGANSIINGNINAGANMFEVRTYDTSAAELLISGQILSDISTGGVAVRLSGTGTDARARLILENQIYVGRTENASSVGSIEIRGTSASSGFTTSNNNAALIVGPMVNLGATQNITGAGQLKMDSFEFGDSIINGTNNNYTGATSISRSRLTLGAGGVINGTSRITILGVNQASMQNLGTITTAGAVSVNGYVAASGTSNGAGYGVFLNGNGTEPGVLNAGSIALSASNISSAPADQGARGGSFTNNLNSTVNLGSGAITVQGQGNSAIGGTQVATGSTFSNAGTVTAGSVTLTSSATSSTVVRKGGTYAQTAGTTTLSGALTLNKNGGTGVSGTVGNDAAFNLSGGTFTAASLAVNGGSVSITGGTLNVGSGGASMADRTTTTVGSAGALQIGGNVTLAAGANLIIGGTFNLSSAVATTSVSGRITLFSATATLANAGTINLNVGSSILDLGNLFNGQADGSTYQLITGAGATTGNFSNITGYGGNITGVTFNNVSGLLTFTAVPEPSTYGLLGAGALAAVAFVRRRRKAA